MTDELDAESEIRSAGRITARRWDGVIEADDVEQEIWVRLLEADYLDRLAAMEKPARGAVLRRIGQQIAVQERDDYEVFSGQVYYGTDEVRDLLGRGLLARRRDDLDPSSETLTEWLDLHGATDTLRQANPAHACLLGSRYLLGEDVPDRKELTRAIDGLTREMNRSRRRWAESHGDGPGSRRAVPNGTAQAITAREGS